MPPKKYALKGEPDFHNISDEKLALYLDLTQQMIFAYKTFDKEKTEVLKSIHADLVWEDADRRARSAREAILNHDSTKDSAPVTMTKVPKLRKSPAKRKI